MTDTILKGRKRTDRLAPHQGAQTVKVTVTLPSKLHYILKAIADSEEISLSAQINIWLAKHLKDIMEDES